MIISDGFYVVSIIIYLLTQLFYLWFYISSYGFFENELYKKYVSKKVVPNNNYFSKFKIFGFTLIVNFWQKWLYETLIAKEEICEELIKHNRSCIGHRHYSTNFTMMSEVEQEAYHLMVCFCVAKLFTFCYSK